MKLSMLTAFLLLIIACTLHVVVVDVIEAIIFEHALYNKVGSDNKDGAGKARAMYVKLGECMDVPSDMNDIISSIHLDGCVRAYKN